MFFTSNILLYNCGLCAAALGTFIALPKKPSLKEHLYIKLLSLFLSFGVCIILGYYNHWRT